MCAETNDVSVWHKTREIFTDAFGGATNNIPKAYPAYTLISRSIATACHDLRPCCAGCNSCCLLSCPHLFPWTHCWQRSEQHQGRVKKGRSWMLCLFEVCRCEPGTPGPGRMSSRDCRDRHLSHMEMHGEPPFPGWIHLGEQVSAMSTNHTSFDASASA